MRAPRRWICALLTTLIVSGTPAAELTRAQAVAALERPDVSARIAAVERLAMVGTMTEAESVLARLNDSDIRVRNAAAVAIWRIWGRSGDPAIDKLYAAGLDAMAAQALDVALAAFDEIIRRKPSFAEGWNKRATIYYLLGDYSRSLKDCAEVFKRNPHHFGALAGAGQIQLQLGNPRLALQLFRRAVEINPALDGPALLIPQLEEQIREDDKHRT